MSTPMHHLDYEPQTGDSWCVECQIVFSMRTDAEAHTSEPVEWVDSSCGKCTPCRDTYGPNPTHGPNPTGDARTPLASDLPCDERDVR